jgi:hypothetical protein
MRICRGAVAEKNYIFNLGFPNPQVTCVSFSTSAYLELCHLGYACRVDCRAKLAHCLGFGAHIIAAFTPTTPHRTSLDDCSITPTWLGKLVHESTELGILWDRLTCRLSLLFHPFLLFQQRLRFLHIIYTGHASVTVFRQSTPLPLS